MSQLCLPNDGTAETQYLDLIRQLLGPEADVRPDRTGVGTRSLHGATMRFDLSQGHVPLLTTKRVPFRLIEREMRWFLSGDTRLRPLLQDNVHIWSEWPHDRYVKATGDDISLEEFEQRILKEDAFAEQWGDLGPVYGKQWRRWEGPDGKVYDQISDLVEQIKNNPYSRRLLFHGWNVAEVDQMALPPCHLLYQYYVADGRLSCTLYQRSCDMGLGVPFNIVGAAVLLRMMAQQVGLEPGQLFWVGHDVHLYANHVQEIKVQLEREPRPFPKLMIERCPEDLFSYRSEDFRIEGYDPHQKISMPVAV